LKNFGEFFANQIEHAGTIILSRTGEMSDEKINAVIALIREHNAKAAIITTPWDKLEGVKILEAIEDAKDLEAELMKEVLAAHDDEHEHHHHDHDHEHHHEDDEHEHHHHDHDHEHHHEDDEHEHHHHDHDHEHHHEDDEHEHHHHDHDHEHHHHDHDGHDHHHHHADEVFTSVGIETSSKFTKAQVQACLDALEDEEKYGVVLRAKGMLPTEGDTFIHFDHVPGESEIRDGSAEYTGKICVIGSQLNEENIKALFEA
jgi:hypothetical protein